MSAARILIVDDHDEFRRAATALLTVEGAEVVGSAATGLEGLSLVAELRPDIVLLDIQLPDVDGVEVARRLAAGGPPTSVILISSRDDAAADPRVASAPVRGFIPKRELAWASIRAVAD